MYKFQIGEKQLKSSFGYKMMMCRVRVKVRYAKLSANIKKKTVQNTDFTFKNT